MADQQSPSDDSPPSFVEVLPIDIPSIEISSAAKIPDESSSILISPIDSSPIMIDMEEIPADKMIWHPATSPSDFEVVSSFDGTSETAGFGTEAFERGILGSSMTVVYTPPTGRPPALQALTTSTASGGDAAADPPQTADESDPDATYALLLFHCRMCLATLGKDAAAFTFDRIDSIQQTKQNGGLVPCPEPDEVGRALDHRILEIGIDKMNGEFTRWERQVEPRIDRTWVLAERGIYVSNSGKCLSDRLVFIKYVKNRSIPTDESAWIEDQEEEEEEEPLQFEFS
ncbi:hypothetical protein ABW21_db0200456 [Orbilia brochopaga]|nr:hypothetical protein ABW21_db0200456 [Drechslerella brochopaga]